MEMELEVIDRMGFNAYFLIVWDFVTWAKSNGISVGPGRGSAAGSLVAYCLRITDVDPLRYGLLFERFLNPERVSMPDIDIDFFGPRARAGHALRDSASTAASPSPRSSLSARCSRVPRHGTPHASTATTTASATASPS